MTANIIEPGGFPQDELLAPSPGSGDTNELLLLDRMARFRRNPIEWFQEVSLFISGVGWRAYDQIIGQDCFYSGYTDKTRKAVLSSELLQKKVTDLANARVTLEQNELLVGPAPGSRTRRQQDIEDSLYQMLHGMVDRMICKMESKAYIRAAFYGCTQLTTRAYNGIYVSRVEVERLRQVAAVAAKKKQSIIFLPRHSSHIDYVSLHLICYRLGLTLPIVVAGDNLNFPLVGSFLQHTGAMWIRRSFDGDPLYTALVQAYLDTLLQKGYNLECFIEGTRSRSGKLLQPKFGILSFLLDSILSGRTEDAYICPVSLQYDRVIEVDSYVTELLGKPKQKENLTNFLSSTSVLSLNLGRIDCRFHEPWSLKEFIVQQKLRQPRPLQEASTGTAEYSQLRTGLLRTLGYRVLSDINDVAVIMPTALVGTVLLTLRGRGVGMSELVRRVDWLCERIHSNGGQVAEFNGNATQYMVERALEVLGPELVGIVEGLAEPTYYAVDRFQLSFYRNMTIHLFLSESLIAAALYTKVKQGGGSANQCISEDALREQVTFLSQLFRGEFIFPVGQGIQRNTENAMASLVGDHVLELSQSGEGIGQIGLTGVEREMGRENFDFYCFLIWPFVDAAWLGAVSLLCLVPPQGSSTVWLDMKAVQDNAQVLGRTLYHQGDLSYFEAVNKEALKNAYSRFQEETMVVVSRSRESKIPPTVRLAADWMPERDVQTGQLNCTGRLWNFIENISRHRREGKNRRDGATVSLRVLALATKLGHELFQVTGTAVAAANQETEPLKEHRRRSKL